MNAIIKKIQAPAKRVWEALAARQNRGVFAAQQHVEIPTQADPRTHIPQGLDLRASGPGFNNLPAKFEVTPSGEAQVTVAGKTIALGVLASQKVETGSMITGLRLRGALRFAEQQLVLLVPDREDIPYLLRTLAPRAATTTIALPYQQVRAA
jgi:hypothetical protein